MTLALSLPLLLLLSGPATSYGAVNALLRESVLVDGRKRTYAVAVPRTRGPLQGIVMLLHGGGREQTGARFAEAVRWEQAIGNLSVVSVYPDGRQGLFQAGACCGRRPEGSHDVRFLTKVLDHVRRRWALQEAFAVAVGFSNGGFMAYRLACERAGRFAAVVAIAATRVSRTCRPRRPVSVLHVHARDDRRVPLAGPVLGLEWVPTPLATVTQWRRFNRCTRDRTRMERTLVLVISTERCRSGTSVRLVLISGAGHSWPGAFPPDERDHLYDTTREVAQWIMGLAPGEDQRRVRG